MSLLVVRYRIIKDSSSYITKKPIPAWLTIHGSYSHEALCETCQQLSQRVSSALATASC